MALSNPSLNYPGIRVAERGPPPGECLQEAPFRGFWHRQRPGATSQGCSGELWFPRWGWWWEGAPGETPEAQESDLRGQVAVMGMVGRGAAGEGSLAGLSSQSRLWLRGWRQRAWRVQPLGGGPNRPRASVSRWNPGAGPSCSSPNEKARSCVGGWSACRSQPPGAAAERGGGQVSPGEP